MELDQAMFEHQKHMKEGAMDEKELLSFLNSRLDAIEGEDLHRQVFNAFDTARKGYLSLQDLTHGFNRVAPFVHKDTIEDIFASADRDKIERLTFRDLQYILR